MSINLLSLTILDQEYKCPLTCVPVQLEIIQIEPVTIPNDVDTWCPVHGVHHISLIANDSCAYLASWLFRSSLIINSINLIMLGLCQ